MKICYLSYKEARDLARDRVIPDCGSGRHIHLTKRDAKKLVDNGGADAIDDLRIMPRKFRHWQPKRSGNATVMQLVVKRGRRAR